MVTIPCQRSGLSFPLLSPTLATDNESPHRLSRQGNKVEREKKICTGIWRLYPLNKTKAGKKQGKRLVSPSVIAVALKCHPTGQSTLYEENVFGKEF